MKNLLILLLVTCFMIMSNCCFSQIQNDTNIKYISWKKLSISVAGKTTIRLGKKIYYDTLSVSEIMNADSLVLIGTDSDKYVIESYNIFVVGHRVCDIFWHCKGSKICHNDFSKWASHPSSLDFTNIIVVDRQKQRRQVYDVSFTLRKIKNTKSKM